MFLFKQLCPESGQKQQYFRQFYHSQKDKEIVGIAKVIATAHPDSTTDDPRWECVDLAAVAPVVTPVTLSAIKATPDLENMVLVHNSRLSVQPVTAQEWQIICKMGSVDPKALN